MKLKQVRRRSWGGATIYIYIYIDALYTEELGPPAVPCGRVQRLARCPGVASEALEVLGLGETSGTKGFGL